MVSSRVISVYVFPLPAEELTATELRGS